MWFLLEKGIRLDLKLVNRKLAACGMKFDAKKFVERIEGMAKLWRVDLKNLIIGELPEFEAIKDSVIKSVWQL